MTPDEKVQAVYEHWNSYKGMGNWKSCRDLMPHQKNAIKDLLRQGYTIDNIIDAITNYAKILLGREYQWSYAWKLYEFLTRGKKWDRSDKQIYRFIGDFNEEDFLSDSAKRWRRYRDEKQIPKEVGDFYDKALPKKVPKLKSKCAQRSDIDRLKGK